MSKVKIISNPYKKETIFQKWSVDDQDWITITSVNSKNSKLLKLEFKEGFFPFKVNKIVACLAEEYSSSEIIEVYFEGSDDEFKELEEVCADEALGGKIIPYKSEMELANARDILPAVRKLFQEMSPLILQSVSREKIERDLNRFTDASSDVVPICVFGNYSAGKSTFINALIGGEILPSGTEPVTAKVYKISRSRFKDRAYVKFIFAGYQIEIHFTETDTVLNNGISESKIISLIKEPFAIYGKLSVKSTFHLNTFDNATLYVPAGTIVKYKATDGWKDFVNIVDPYDLNSDGKISAGDIQVIIND